MKAVIAHFVLAVLGLGAAYNVWSTPEGDEELSESSVVVVDCEPDDLRSITVKSEKGVFEIGKRKTKNGEFWWGTTTKTPEKGDKTVKEFAISKKIDDYFKVAAPMRAVRNLGSIDKDLAKEVELADAKTSFELACADKTHVFEVGIAASGSGDRYIRKKGGGSVYLVRRDLIDQVERAESQLMQRKLTDHEDRDAAKLEVHALKAKATLLHHNRLDPKKAEWVDAANPDQRNELYSNWLSRVSRLSISEYLGPEQNPGDEKDRSTTANAAPDAGAPATSNADAKLETVAKLRYLDEGGDLLDEVEIARLGEQQADYYAKSTTTRAWVRVLNSVGRQVEGDLPMVVGLEEIPKTPAQPKPDQLPSGHPPI